MSFEEFTLSETAKAAGYQLAAFEALGSTNIEALSRGHNSVAERGWVVARQQTAGKGSRGRGWISPLGNLYASLFIQTRLPLPLLSSLGFVAGLALEKSIVQCAPFLSGRIQLKWPNDLLVDGAKLSGILLETEPTVDGARVLVVGMGVNITAAPTGLAYPAMSLLSLGCNASSATLFAVLTESWIELERLWDEGRGFSVIRNLWLEKAAGLGAPVNVKIGPDEISGIFETMDDMGRLVVRRSDDGTRTIAAGEVYFSAASAAGKD